MTVYATHPTATGQGAPIEKTFLYMLNKPEHVENGGICEENPSEHFTLRVIALPISQFLPLPDGSFVISSQGGLGVDYPAFVMRFDDRFQTKSQILKGRLFIVDTATLQRWLSRADYADYGLMQRGLLRWLTDKNQGRN